jgi:mannosyltransferase OCH1-like enzyme
LQQLLRPRFPRFGSARRDRGWIDFPIVRPIRHDARLPGTNPFALPMPVRTIHIFVVSRLIKLLANVAKMLCYGIHFVFPKARFRLPARARPLHATRTPSVIPRILWQTNYTDRVTLPVYLNYLFNRLMSPTFEYRFMITEARADFVRDHCSRETFDCYSRLQIGAAQADFWRLLVLYEHGGVYLDIDGHVVWPLGRIVATKHRTIGNHFIASKPGNPHLARLIEVVVDNIRLRRHRNVYELTGPGVLNLVLDIDTINTRYYLYTCSQGNFTNEYFQYIDKPQGKWTKEQQEIEIIRADPT